jgi:predicted DsbA family dithiol-disulfide isomerase
VAALEAMARKLGLDMRRYRHDVADAATEARIERESALCQQLGASGTPTFFFNGRKLVGARPLADFEAGVDEESGRSP